ncbi:MAG: class I SAM-dependent methyltransferase [Hyphomicrobium sp.]|nr:class I SAM-dependent methyltransferase [Hyphomicrobium sp.]
MTSEITAARELASGLARFGWYTGIGALAERRAARAGAPRPPRPAGRVVPDSRTIMTDILDLFRRDAALVRDGAAAATSDDGSASFADHIDRLRAMFLDLPRAAERRADHETTTARTHAGETHLPDYFVQDFHFQNGGYLSDKSARLYDVQVETLFRGTAHAMRRQALRPIADFMMGRDQRMMSLLDIACGTGRFLREVRRAYPALALTGLDLSRPYLNEAERAMRGLRPASWLEANAEAIPLEDASQDIVTSIYLFHELPPEVRRIVAREIARVLKPGGVFVFVDSLQKGDREGGWDGFLEGFPERFHEPYYRHYTIDDLDAVFAECGLAAVSAWPAFLSKVMVRRKLTA